MITKLFEFSVSQFVGDDIETLRSEKFALVIKVKSKNKWVSVETEKDIKIEIRRTRGLEFEHLKIDFIEVSHITIVTKDMKENEEKYFKKEVFIEEMKQAIHRFMITKEVAYPGYEKTFFSIDKTFEFWVVLRDDSFKINEYFKKDGKRLNYDERELLNELTNKSYKEIKKEKTIKYAKIFFANALYLILLPMLLVGFLFMIIEGSDKGFILFIVPFTIVLILTAINIRFVNLNMKKFKEIKKTLEEEGFSEEAIQDYKNFRKNFYNILKI